MDRMNRREFSRRPRHRILTTGSAAETPRSTGESGGDPWCPYECVQTGSVTDCGQCEEIPEKLEVHFGDVVCCREGAFDQVLTNQHENGSPCVYHSEEFECRGEDEDEGEGYTTKWVLTIGATESTLTLQVDAEGTTLTYRLEGEWCCLCSNEMILDCPPTECSTLGNPMARRVCVSPNLENSSCQSEECEVWPLHWSLEMSGITGNCETNFTQTDCDCFNGTHILGTDYCEGLEHPLPSCDCVWTTHNDTFCICCSTTRGSQTGSVSDIPYILWKRTSDGPVGWVVDACPDNSRARYFIPEDDFNCFGENTLNLESITETTSRGTCTGWPETLTIQPAA